MTDSFAEAMLAWKMEERRSSRRRGKTQRRANRSILSHHSDHARDCAYCGEPMTSSDVNDYGSLCRRCFMREYYGKEED